MTCFISQGMTEDFFNDVRVVKDALKAAEDFIEKLGRLVKA